MNSKFIPEHDYFGPCLMKSSQSNFNLQLPGSYLARSYLIATVIFVSNFSQIVYQFTKPFQKIELLSGEAQR